MRVEEKKGIYSKSVLDNGLTVVSEQVSGMESYSIGVCINVGSRDDNISGIAHFMEHAAFRHTKKRTSKQIANGFESLGAYSNAFTTKEVTCFYARAINQHFQKIFEILSDITINTIFIEEEIEKEKLIILEEIKSYEDDPEEYIFDFADKIVFDKHELAPPISGEQDTVSKIKYTDLKDFHSAYYIPENITICVAGDINHKNIIKLAERYFSNKFHLNISNSNNFERYTRNSILDILSPQKRHVSKPIQQAHLVMGKTTTGIRSDERYPLAVLNILFGDGMSSRLYQNLREKYGLAYTIYSSLNNYTDCGSWYIYAATDGKKYEKIIDLVYKEMQKILSDKIPTKKELQRAKEQLKTATIIEFESMSSRMQNLLKYSVSIGKYEDILQIIQKIENVSLDDIEELATKYFDSDWSIAAILPE